MSSVVNFKHLWCLWGCLAVVQTRRVSFFTLMNEPQLFVGDRAITYRFNPLYYSGPQTLISEYAARGPWTRDHIPSSLPAKRRTAFKYTPALWSMWGLQWAAAVLSPKSCPPRRRHGPPPLNRSCVLCPVPHYLSPAVSSPSENTANADF